MTASPPQLDISSSRQFLEWLAEQGISLAFTTYQTGKLFLVGLQPNDRLSIFERTFNRVMVSTPPARAFTSVRCFNSGDLKMPSNLENSIRGTIASMFHS
jgi:hypothetical protein